MDMGLDFAVVGSRPGSVAGSRPGSVAGSRPGSSAGLHFQNETFMMEPADDIDWEQYHGGLFNGPGTQTYSVSTSQQHNHDSPRQDFNSRSPGVGGAFPVRPRKAGHTRPGSLTPSRTRNITPSQRPGSVTPSRPGSVTPSRPGSVTPSRPGSVTPSRPGRVTPSQRPGSVTPSGPGNVTPSSNRSNPSTPKNKHQPSFVDESLFGPKPPEPDFPAPWDDGKKPVYVMDATDYKMQQKLREQRAKHSNTPNGNTRTKPIVASHKILKGGNRTFTKGSPSHVDEMLFGRDQFSPNGRRSRSEPRPDSSRSQNSDIEEMSARGTRAPSRSDRPPSAAHSGPGRPSSASTKQAAKKRDKHQPSYVDELLFGPRPAEPDFPAPWEDLSADKQRGRPFWYDGTDYRVAGNADKDRSRPTSRGSQSRARARSAARDSPSKPPPWR